MTQQNTPPPDGTSGKLHTLGENTVTATDVAVRVPPDQIAKADVASGQKVALTVHAPETPLPGIDGMDYRVLTFSGRVFDIFGKVVAQQSLAGSWSVTVRERVSNTAKTLPGIPVMP